MKKTTLPKIEHAALERVLKILIAVARSEKKTADDFAKEFECSAKTVRRDLDFIRDRLGIQLEYNGYWHVVGDANFPAWLNDLKAFFLNLPHNKHLTPPPIVHQFANDD